jgi:hypothetical protein
MTLVTYPRQRINNVYVTHASGISNILGHSMCIIWSFLVLLKRKFDHVLAVFAN